MKTILTILFSSVTIIFYIVLSTAFAQVKHLKKIETAKTNCMQVSKNLDINQIKDQLLITAKKSAASELYGDLIYSNSILDNGIIVNDEVHANCLGLIKINGDPLYFNGHNLGEICIKIKAFVTEKDKDIIMKKIRIAQQNTKKNHLNSYKINNNNNCVMGTASISAQCRTNPCPLSQKRINAEIAAAAQAEMKMLTSKHNTKISISNGETHSTTDLLKMGKIRGRPYPPIIDGDIVKVKYCLEIVEDFFEPK